MISDETAKEMLKAISLQGSVEEDNAEVHLVLGSRNNLNTVMNFTSGLPKIRPDIVKKFKLILSTPALLSSLSPFEIRCCMCKRVIRFPCWYYSIRYVVNHFHYFVCFDPNSSDKVSAKCYKRG